MGNSGRRSCPIQLHDREKRTFNEDDDDDKTATDKDAEEKLGKCPSVSSWDEFAAKQIIQAWHQHYWCCVHTSIGTLHFFGRNNVVPCKD